MPTIEAFYLGTMSDIDPDEDNYASENSSDLVGLTFGSNNAPLYDSIDALTLEDVDGDQVLYSNDNDQNAENLSYDGTSSALDSEIRVNVTVTYTDGTTATTQMGVLQDVSGRMFLIPHREGSSQNEVLDDHPIVSIQIASIERDDFQGMYTDVEQDAFITCFAAGTLIATKKGQIDIAHLSVGDSVVTMDHGYQPIRWIGARRERAIGKFAPIRIMQGALGQGLPTRDLRVSPQHRILVRSKIAQRMFGSFEVLLPAKKMLGLPGISVDRSTKNVTYWHILFNSHEIVFSEGAATESFYTGSEAMKAIGTQAQGEIFSLFPELEHAASPPVSARPIVQGKQQNQLLAQHQKNARNIFQSGMMT
ncbi:Hint domain-containing protein [Profundibacter sp.]